jgi:hypothetical protein
MKKLSRMMSIFLTVICISVGLLSSVVYADDSSNFYTVIDEDGHMRSIQKKSADGDKSSPLASSSPKASANPMMRLDGQEYVDSEYLEKRKFNLAGKKTFYTMPDGQGGTQVIERVPGAIEPEDTSQNQALNPNQPLITLSKTYERVNALDITSLIGMKCIPAKAFQNTQILRNQQIVIWPRSDAPKVNHHASLNYVIVEFGSNNRDISLQSFAPLGLKSDYYWPLPIFLDEQGCVLEGVNAYYQKTLPSTMLQPSVLIGNLHVPEHAKYLMLTPLHEAIDLPNIRLSEVGQVRLIPLR